MATTSQNALLETLATEEIALATLLGRIDDEQWATVRRADGWGLAEVFGHLGDSAYGMAMLAEKGSVPAGAPTDANGNLDIDALNERRRERHATMDRPTIEQRVHGGLAEARRVIAHTSNADLGSPGPFGPTPTKGEWLTMLLQHTASHRHEIEALVGE